MNKAQILGAVNWTAALAAPRYAGGHEEVVRALFEGVAPVIAWWREGGYDGTIAAAFRFPDGTVLVVTDYYGSCSGCDAWEACDDAAARGLITGMISSGRVFPTVGAAIHWSRSAENAEDYPFRAARNLWPKS